MLSPSLSTPAVCGVVTLILFLSYSSQYLFAYIDPGPLTARQSTVFNALVASLLICYARSCLTDPGSVPTSENGKERVGRRWCKKCDNWKPPRAHHCKVCKRCITKMDHHCPWTTNCVSHRTFLHFLRFILFAVAAMSQLEGFLFTRVAELWANREMPHYLGPSKLQLAHLLLLVLFNSFTLFALAILLVRTLWCLGANTTTIEGWEIERHEALLRRARINGGYVHGPNGVNIRLNRQEFPYDIGIWKNIVQGMGSSNPLAWFWPMSPSPTVESGLDFETNGFEDSDVSWPPPDPDRMPFRPRELNGAAFTHDGDVHSQDDRIEAFKARQQQDLKRWTGDTDKTTRRRELVGHHDELSSESDDEDHQDVTALGERWTNTEGETLEDFGIDEEAEFDDEDDIPLSQLVARRKSKIHSE